MGEAGNGLEALDLIAALSPDLVFIDVEMPFDRIASIQTQDVGGYLVTLNDGTRLRTSRAYASRVRALLR